MSRSTRSSLYGAGQSLLARYLERRERRRPDPVVAEHRRRLLAGLTGRVIEIGCGDGRNFEHYPAGVDVVALEPDPAAREEARRRAAAAAARIEVVEGRAEALPAADAAFDAAVCCWLLCSVAAPSVVLAELHRVLRPGGELRFYEHVRSRKAGLRLLQRAVDATFWPRALGGCRTTRDSEAAIRSAGFEFTELERPFHSSSWLTFPSAPHILGRATRAST